MHRITLLSVGKVKTPWTAEGCAVYAERIGHFCDFSERVLSSGSAREEHARILEALEKTKGIIVILDERGKELTSRGLAQWIGKQRDTGEPVTFVLGGAYGFSDAIRAKATLVLRLSAMTLPHELCKVLFLEQLYRAHSILAGSGYHH